MSDLNIAGIDFTDETKSSLYGAVLGKLREYNASSRLPSNVKWHKSYPTNWERLDNPKAKGETVLGVLAGRIACRDSPICSARSCSC